MKAVGEPDAGNPSARLDKGLMGNAISLLYQSWNKLPSEPQYTEDVFERAKKLGL
jgi:hypothetical protein